MKHALPWLLTLLPVPLALAQTDIHRDRSLRVDYGYYAGDRSVISAVADELESDVADDPHAAYLSALSSLRQAQLSASGEATKGQLTRCIDHAALAEDSRVLASEAQVLIAACSMELAGREPLMSAVHQRRMSRALRAADMIDPDNPRTALLRLQARYNDGDVPTAGEIATVAEQFATQRAMASINWGEAEAYLMLAESLHAAGDVRAARDALENALLAAPEYRAALALGNELLGGP